MAEFNPPRIKVALFDMAATTVDDMVEKPGLEDKLPLVISAYQDAFKKGGIEMSFDELNDCRGKDKIQVFQEKVQKYRADLPEEERNNLARRLHDEEFVPALLGNVQYIREMPGTTETFKYLKSKGIFIATGSGFPQNVTDAINEHLGWRKQGVVDFGTCGAAAGGGRPKPNMINTTLIEAGYFSKEIERSKRQDFDYRIVLKVGDTEEDVREGLGVGATTVAVSSGTQSVDKLVKSSPLVVLPSVAALSLYLDNHNYFN